MKHFALMTTCLLVGGCSRLGPTSGELYDAAQCYSALAKLDTTVTVRHAETICWDGGKSPV